MTAAFASGRRTENRAEQLESLRRQMASVAGKTVPGAAAARADDLLPGSGSRLPLPQWLADALPAPLPRGSVAVLTGARSLLLGMVAAVTAAGGNAVIVGQPDIGLLAVAEMGADLSRLAVIPDPGTDPVEVAAVLVDGMDLVVLGLGGRKIPPTRARAVVARARTRGCTLLVTDGDGAIPLALPGDKARTAVILIPPDCDAALMGQIADRVVTLSDLRGLANVLTMLVPRTQVA